MIQEKKKSKGKIAQKNIQNKGQMIQENAQSMQSKELELHKKTESMEIQAGEQERCVLCGKLTGICRDTPIKRRKYYIEAAGQLCADCYAEIYMPSHNDNIIK